MRRSSSARFLIDANRPRRFALWSSSDCLHVQDLGDAWSDRQVWDYAVKNGLTIVTKDADFSDRVMFQRNPPSVIHLRIGNMRMRAFHAILGRVWPEVLKLAAKHKLVRVFVDRIECAG